MSQTSDLIQDCDFYANQSTEYEPAGRPSAVWNATTEAGPPTRRVSPAMAIEYACGQGARHRIAAGGGWFVLGSDLRHSARAMAQT